MTELCRTVALNLAGKKNERTTYNGNLFSGFLSTLLFLNLSHLGFIFLPILSLFRKKWNNQFGCLIQILHQARPSGL